MDSVLVDFNLDHDILMALENSELNRLLLTDEFSGKLYGSLKLNIQKQAQKSSLSLVSALKRNAEMNAIISSKPKQAKQFPTTSKTAKVMPNKQSAVNTKAPMPPLQSQGSVIFGKDMDNNLVCPMCQKTFTAQHTANRHFMNVHNKISYKCEMCDYSCRKDYLKQHAMKNHGINEAMAKLMVQNAKPMQN